jgi:hypothetical protein
LKKILPLIFFNLLLFSCQNKEKPTLAFYYWKTIYQLSKKENQTLSANGVAKIYTRYFDIDLHPITGSPYPVSPIHFDQKTNSFQIIPVVYIKNKVFKSSEINTRDLAQKTVDFIGQINRKNQISITEIQIDCDWTESTKERYLSFLKELKKVSKKKLSATIRLHQIKYFKKTAIPTVDYGVLMYYNMGEIAPNSKNSIYESEIAQRYLPSLKKYPLRLNVALPIFSWAIHIRNGKVIGLRNKIDWHDFETDKHFTSLKNNWLEVVSTNYKKGILYRKGDKLKPESVSEDALFQMAEEVAENQKEIPNEIIIYDLDEFNLNHYENNIFEKLRHCF